MSADPVAPAAPGAPAVVTSGAALTREHGLRLLHEMLRIRRFEEKCAELYSAGKIRGFLHLYMGEEAIAAGAMRALRPDDAVVAGGLVGGSGVGVLFVLAGALAVVVGLVIGVVVLG